MEIDFHYYATFAAARIAGFGPEDAATIAHSAQYVDDSSLSRLAEPAQVAQYLASPAGGYRPHITRFRPVATYQPEEELGRLEVLPAWTHGDINALRRVWSVFHFLPGNYDGNPGVVSYTGSREWSVGPVSPYTFDDDAEQAFRLMCLPNSRLAEDMVNDVAANYAGADNRLHSAGIRMHVLADTWAHCYFAGTPQYWVNDAGGSVHQIDPASGRRAEVRWKNVKWAESGFASGDTEMAIWPSAYVVSSCYLGHGRMGHLPDYPWMMYEYTPKWSGRPIVKDNPTYFLRGFIQMCAALRAIHDGKRFDAQASSDVPREVAEKIGAIIRLSSAPGIGRDCEARARVWREQLPDLVINGVRIGEAPRYDPDAWINGARGRYDDHRTDYFRFNLAARQHHDFVIARLREHTGIDLNAGNSGLGDDLKEAAKWIADTGGRTARTLIEVGDTVVEGGKALAREAERLAREAEREAERAVREAERQAKKALETVGDVFRRLF